jgi:agmatinase
MKTSAVFFPFDLFGSAGAGSGANLLADEFREVLDDNRRERVQTRAQAYTSHVRVRQHSFETLDAYGGWRKQGRQAARQAIRQENFLLWVTGNHLGALPVYDELSDLGTAVLVVQFDAHLDIHHFADCTREPSHGNFLLHCDGALPPLVNAGHRELLLTTEYIGKHYRQTFSAVDLAIDPQPALDQLARLALGAERVFLDIDCDVFDPVYFPAVSQPVPFGLTPSLLLRLLDAVWSPRIAGVIISEFNPSRDRDDMSLATAMWMIEYLLLRKYET